MNVTPRPRPEIGDLVLLPDHQLLEIIHVANPSDPWWFRAHHSKSGVVLASNSELTWDLKQHVWRERPMRHILLPNGQLIRERRHEPREADPSLGR